MNERMTATEALEPLNERAREAYRKSAGFQRRVSIIVSHVLNEHGRVDPERADRDAHDIATKVAAMTLQMIYEEDNEIRSMKAELDAIRAAYEKWVLVTPLTPQYLVKTPLLPPEA